MLVNREGSEMTAEALFAYVILKCHFNMSWFICRDLYKAKNKIFFVSPYLKKMAVPNFFFMIWKLKIFFFIHQNLTFLYYFVIFRTILLQNSKLNTVGNDIFKSYVGIHYPSSRTKTIVFTDQPTLLFFNRVG